MRKNEEAFTGLEAAIVLIAFVVVAAVFSYVVLGAGFFTTQKSQEVVHSGVTSAASNIVVKGNVYGSSSDNETVESIIFDVGLAAGGLPIDMAKTVMIYSDQNTAPYTLVYETGWNITEKNPAGDDVILQTGETFRIKVTPDDSIAKRVAFEIEIKPEQGAALAIARTVPPSLTPNTLLY